MTTLVGDGIHAHPIKCFSYYVHFTEYGKKMTAECEKWKTLIIRNTNRDGTWHKCFKWRMINNSTGVFEPITELYNDGKWMMNIAATLTKNGFVSLDRTGQVFYIANPSANPSEFKTHWIAWFERPDDVMPMISCMD